MCVRSQDQQSSDFLSLSHISYHLLVGVPRVIMRDNKKQTLSEEDP